MKTLRYVIIALIFSGLASYSLFLIPSADAKYYGYDDAGDHNNSSNYLSSQDNNSSHSDSYVDPYYSNNYYDDRHYNNWPSEADWFNDKDWFNRSSWGVQNNWFDSQYANLNTNCHENFYMPNDYSSIWRSHYYDGSRRVLWNYSNQPMLYLNNYGANNWVYANQYYDDYSPCFARTFAITDANNINNAIVVINSADYSGYGPSLSRANIVVSSEVFMSLLNILDQAGSNCNLNLDCQSNYLRYGYDGNHYNYGYIDGYRGI